MKKAPRQSRKSRISDFKEWLVARGAEVLIPTSEWELVRFRANGITSIWYRDSKEVYTHTGEMGAALAAFTANEPWRGAEATKRVAKPSTEIRTLIKRDGDACFLCGLPLGQDITTEHLVAITHGGPNHIANKVLAHEVCNHEMNHRSVMEKIRMREAKRSALEVA